MLPVEPTHDESTFLKKAPILATGTVRMLASILRRCQEALADACCTATYMSAVMFTHGANDDKPSGAVYCC